MNWLLVAGGAATVFVIYVIVSNAQSQIESPIPFVASTKSLTIDDYKQYALDAINKDRTNYNLTSVNLDSDNLAAQMQADEMLKTRKLSHWTTDGMKPYMRYSTNGGTGFVEQNAAWEASTGGDPFYDARADACKKGFAYCGPLDIKKAIDFAENAMINDDLKCCNNGHRDNILDKFHTEVSLGIAFDNVDFFMIQNFENQYVNWQQPISYNSTSNIVSMGGVIASNVTLDNSIDINYDPLPTAKTYTENRDRTSYDGGQQIAEIVPPAPTGYYYNQLNDSVLIQAGKWNTSGHNFDITFPLDNATQRYGSGVYTVTLLANDTSGDIIPLTSVSVFKR